MYEVLKAGGFSNGGLNFDAKTRRMSYTPEDQLYAFIAGMDTFALGLRKAAAIIEDGRIDEFTKERYSSWQGGIGASIIAGREDFVSLAKYAEHNPPQMPSSGRQEYLENLVNRILFR
jgi:xylose isomerase